MRGGSLSPFKEPTFHGERNCFFWDGSTRPGWLFSRPKDPDLLRDFAGIPEADPGRLVFSHFDFCIPIFF